MVRLGAVQKAAHDRSLAEYKQAARGQRSATTSSATDKKATGSGYSRIRIRKAKIRL